MGAGLGLPSHRGILMSSLARSDEGVGGGVTKTDDSRPALLIFLLGEGVTTRCGCGRGRVRCLGVLCSGAMALQLLLVPHALSSPVAPPPSSPLPP